MSSLFSNVQSRLTILVGGGIGLLLLVASIAVFQLKSHIDEFNSLLATSVQAEREVSILNLSFKIQVQEWKNVLLRGKDPEKLQKYWDQFSSLHAVARIHDMNTQIATAAEEQSYAAEEINKNVVRVVHLVENAATNAQKSTQVAHELDAVARDLERQITHFSH